MAAEAQTEEMIRKEPPFSSGAALGSHTSSSAVSTPEENGHVYDSKSNPQSMQELKTCPKRELIHASVSKEKKQPSKCKSMEEIPRAMTAKRFKNFNLRKLSSNNSSLTSSQAPKKQPRKGECPVQLHAMQILQDTKSSSTWICKNSACKAVLTSDSTFCKRCSCCICHLFDDNKDPSLWLVCSSESSNKDCCESSCHIECALQHQKAGCIDLGQSMQLDGSYCCASCGKVIGILGFWKRQLMVAKNARRVDILCYRIYLSYRLLDGTSRFKELHKTVEDAKTKLETEVGPLDGMSAKLARGIVGRLSVAGEVQKLCSLAIEKADEWLRSTGPSNIKLSDSLPAACRFRFEDITSSSLVVVLREAASSPSDAIKGYKLWYWKSRESPCMGKPVIFPKDQWRILISNLQPCTEYAFRIISFTEDGELGHSESKCFTRSVEIIHKNTEHNGAEGCSSSAKREGKNHTCRSSGFKVRQLGKVLRHAWAQEHSCPDYLCQDEIEDSCGRSGSVIPDTGEQDRAAPTVSRRLDLNVSSVPDLNAEVIMPVECSRDENGCSSEKNGLIRSNGNGDSQTCATMQEGEVPAMESQSEGRKQQSDVEQETCGDDSTLIIGTPMHFAHRLGQLDDNYEYCVKVIRWLECSGHIKKDFSMKFLTWFSLRSTEQERRVVITFIRTLVEDPSSLAGQLLDSFSEIVSCKRPRSGFCTKLWH